MCPALRAPRAERVGQGRGPGWGQTRAALALEIVVHPGRLFRALEIVHDRRDDLDHCHRVIGPVHGARPAGPGRTLAPGQRIAWKSGQVRSSAPGAIATAIPPQQYRHGNDERHGHPADPTGSDPGEAFRRAADALQETFVDQGRAATLWRAPGT